MPEIFITTKISQYTVYPLHCKRVWLYMVLNCISQNLEPYGISWMLKIQLTCHAGILLLHPGWVWQVGIFGPKECLECITSWIWCYQHHNFGCGLNVCSCFEGSIYVALLWIFHSTSFHLWSVSIAAARSLCRFPTDTLLPLLSTLCNER